MGNALSPKGIPHGKFILLEFQQKEYKTIMDSDSFDLSAI